MRTNTTTTARFSDLLHTLDPKPPTKRGSSPSELEKYSNRLGNPSPVFLFDEPLDGLELQGGIPNGTSAALSTFSMLPTAEDRGINYFIANFVTASSGPSHGYFNYFHEVCFAGGLEDTLKSSTTASGLAIYANTTKSPQLMSLARKEYTAALRHINAALRSPTDSVRDSTLLSIIVVSLFETATGSRQLSLKAWTEHINGAATLVKLRGRAQLRNCTGLRMFQHATSHLLISCVMREIPMPQQLMELRLEAFNYFPLDPAWQFLKKMDEYTLFRAAIKSESLQDHQTIIETALRLDADLTQIFSDVPSGWLYETVYTPNDPDIVFDGYYDIYYDHWIAQMWNGMRICRIMLSETVRARLLAGFTSVPPLFNSTEHMAQFQVSTDIVTQMRDDILHSVPQHLGYVKRKPFDYHSRSNSPSPPPSFDPIPDLNSNSSFTSLLFSNVNPTPSPPSGRTSPPLERDPTFPAIGGYFLLWPLYVAGINRVSTPEIRSYVSKMLQYIGDTMGLQQGNALGTFLDTYHPVMNGRFSTQDGPVKGILLGSRPLVELLEKDSLERKVSNEGGGSAGTLTSMGMLSASSLQD